MHFYWRIIEELKYLGENWIFNDPALIRCYGTWIKKNAWSISLTFQDFSSKRPFFEYKGTNCPLN